MPLFKRSESRMTNQNAIDQDGQDVAECSLVHPIKISVENYWQELESMGQCGQLPRVLASELKALINSFIHKTITSQATPVVIQMAKEYLPCGIVLTNGEVENHYTVMVFIPDVGKEQTTRTFFQLVPGYQNGKLRYLDEVA